MNSVPRPMPATAIPEAVPRPLRYQNGLALSPKDANQLGRVLAELNRLAETAQLDRLKMCDSPECHWVFFDRSKPAHRRWCSSERCGNRQKVRAYRARHRSDDGGAQT